MLATTASPSNAPAATVPVLATTRSGKAIYMAQHAGFCHGVRKAVNKSVATQQAVLQQASGATTYILGELIHNQQEIARLEAMGLHTVQQLDAVPDGATCLIRTHGAPPALHQQAAERGITLVDATCPDVRLVQNKAIELAKEGYTVVIVGKATHPEVIGISAFAQEVPNAVVVTVDKPEHITEALAGKPQRRIGVVSQSTQREDTFFEMVKHLAMVAKELKVFNTICPATFFRQQATQALAAQVNVMVIVGGKQSSNTTHLAECCEAQGVSAVHVETAEELATHPEATQLLAAAQHIGVGAGASTPDWVIDGVLDYLKTL